MSIHRGGFIAALFAPFVAKFLPKAALPSFDYTGSALALANCESPNPGMYGLKYYAVPSNLGNYMGIPRASYPGNYIGNSETFKTVLTRQSMPYHIERVRIPGSFHRYMEAERTIHA